MMYFFALYNTLYFYVDMFQTNLMNIHPLSYSLKSMLNFLLNHIVTNP